jgi:hypothetical protein
LPGDTPGIAQVEADVGTIGIKTRCLLQWCQSLGLPSAVEQRGAEVVPPLRPIGGAIERCPVGCQGLGPALLEAIAGGDGGTRFGVIAVHQDGTVKSFDRLRLVAFRLVGEPRQKQRVEVIGRGSEQPRVPFPGFREAALPLERKSLVDQACGVDRRRLSR